MSTIARSPAASKPPKSIVVEALARVEGEGGLTVQLQGGRVADVKLRIYEPPRFFEAFLRGRAFPEVPDITARICGICPVAYQMSSIHAIESRLRRRPCPVRCARCAGWSTAASGSRATRCTCTCCTRPTSSATRAPSTWRRTTARS